MRFVLAFGRQAFKREDKYYFWGGLLVEAVGAGKGLSDQQFAVAERLGVEICYATKGGPSAARQAGPCDWCDGAGARWLCRPAQQSGHFGLWWV